ncbi:MAG TPA: hypothetical protein VFG14_16710 [Chthoniobacteraceae bacterium]|nr:hypothetical protein [Chthoniobacteraceae bacterium]
MNTNHDNSALQTIAVQQRRLKWLTATAIALWILAVLGTVGVLVCYTMFVAPKEKQLMKDFGSGGRFYVADHSADPSPNTNRALNVNFVMTYVATKGILILAISVVVLSLGTLATLILTISSRRVTLRQINHSLAQISEQLRELKERAEGV